MTRWLGAILLATFAALATSGPAAAQTDDPAALEQQFRALYSQGKYVDAATVAERLLKIVERAQGANSPATATALNYLAAVYQIQNRYEEALKAYGRALAIFERTLGPEHPDVAATLNNLALVYKDQGRYEEALKAYVRALTIGETALGPEHLDVANTLNNMGLVYQAQGRYEEALKAFNRALAILETALGPDHPNVASTLNNLALVYKDQGRYEEALKAFNRALAIRERTLGPEHPDVAQTLNNIGLVYRAQGRYEEALKAYVRALAIRETAVGPQHPDMAGTLNNLAELHVAQRDWTRAMDAWQRSTQILERRTTLGAAGLGQPLVGKGKSEATRASGAFQGLVKVAWRREGQAGADTGTMMFAKAQWAAASEAAEALAQMAARGAKGDVKLASLVRERQDLLAEWQKRDEARTAAASSSPDRRNKQVEADNVARIGAIETRIGQIDTALKDGFPDYAALASVAVVSIANVQVVLRDDEALLMFLDTDASFKPLPEETFVWVVTKGEVRWLRSDLGARALTDAVAALRCGLDAALWDDEAAAKRCRGLVTGEPQRDAADTILSETLPFDVARAHALYQALFGQAEDLIRGKHLLIVPSGPLTQLPFQVLVTAEAKGSDLKAAAWLARSHAITVLPAVASLQALRRVARPSTATRPLLGIGNPLLIGNPQNATEAQWARLAREKQACPQTPWQRIAGVVGKGRGVRKVAMRGGYADLDHLRSQVPLHDTADELCAVAKALHFTPDDILLGAKATEATLKTLSSEGKLASYRVVHFATHGTLAGEIEGTSEPGLILTPPKEQTELDDGYLSASEVAALKLDADWIILSACNTAAGGSDKAEALSGLARAFFYAGARALLVSHWSVSSEATVSLITHAVGAISHDRKLGRAEALRRAMLAMIDKGKPHEAHPAYWAPFVVVGEGAAR
jgi:CHAT domain-containing protein/tetratricopeptide (TPR) repeat protein